MQNLEIFSVLIKNRHPSIRDSSLKKMSSFKIFFSKINLSLILKTTYRFGDQISAAPNNFVYKFEIKKTEKILF